METPLEEDRSAQARAEAFALRHGIQLMDRLGFGQDGEVYRADPASVLKVFAEARLFEAEWEAYLRLEEAAILEVSGHAVPVLLRTDFTLRVLQLTMVQPPFVLDFARARARLRIS